VALFNNNGGDFGPDWDLPVVIREVTSASGEKRKVVFVDKPLLKPRATARERNQVYYNAVFQGLCLNPTGDTRVDFEQTRASKNLEAGDPLNLNLNLKEDNLTYNLWNFGNMKILIRCKIHGVVRDPASNYNQLRMVGVKTKLEMDYETGGAMEEVTVDETARWWIYTYIRPDAHLMLGVPLIFPHTTPSICLTFFLSFFFFFLCALLGRIDVHTSQVLSVEKWDMPKILPPVCAFK